MSSEEKFNNTRRLMALLVQYRDAYGANALTNLIVNALLKMYPSRVTVSLIKDIKEVSNEIGSTSLSTPGKSPHRIDGA